MKKNLSLCMALSLMLSIPGQTHAVTFKERVESIRQKAIALAKKGGKYSKKLWDKINFLGRARKEEKAAREALDECDALHYCFAPAWWTNGPQPRMPLRTCRERYCPNERKRFFQATNKKQFFELGLITLILAAGTAVGWAKAEQYQEEQQHLSDEKEYQKALEKRQRRELLKKELKELADTTELEKFEEELKKIQIESGKTGQSPLYEAPK